MPNNFTRQPARPALAPDPREGTHKGQAAARERQARFNAHLHHTHASESCAKVELRSFVLATFEDLQRGWRKQRAAERSMRAIFEAGRRARLPFSKLARKRLADVSRRRRGDEAVLDDLEALYARCCAPVARPTLWLDDAASLLGCLSAWNASERAMWAAFVRASPELARAIEFLSAESVDAARPVRADVIEFLATL